MKVIVRYPEMQEEQLILRSNVQSVKMPEVKPVVTIQEVLQARDLVRDIYLMKSGAIYPGHRFRKPLSGSLPGGKSWSLLFLMVLRRGAVSTWRWQERQKRF